MLLPLLFCLSLAGLHAQSSYTPPADPKVMEKLKGWQDWKFGILIHWGPYSEWGVVESWSLCPEDEPWCERKGPFADDYFAYRQSYENIRQQFNPQRFNPENWARAAKKAGMRYVVFTTKHHDGFCMFDSQLTDYKITDSGSKYAPNPRSNITREVFAAFRQEGLAIGAYFSKPDWHHNDYWWRKFPPTDRNVNYNPEKYPEKWRSFQQYTHQQINELTKDYGPIDILWLDGGWVRPAGSLTAETLPWIGKNQWIQDIDMLAIAAMARKNQPGLLIVDRTVHGEFENYRTPEQQIPDSIPPYPWESCITLGDNWYSTGPQEHYKSAHWAIQTLVKIVAMGGNFLLGIGPDKTGEFVPEVYERLESIGQWMAVNGKAIYETQPLDPYVDGMNYFTVTKDGKQRFLIRLIEEGKGLPDEFDLPEGFAVNNKKIRVMGCRFQADIVQKNGKKVVKLPVGLQKQSVSQPAVVFVF